MRISNIEYPETPTGKRSVKVNIYGNIVGYVSGKRFWEFGCTGSYNEEISQAWVAGKSIEESQFALLD